MTEISWMSRDLHVLPPAHAHARSSPMKQSRQLKHAPEARRTTVRHCDRRSNACLFGWRNCAPRTPSTLYGPRATLPWTANQRTGDSDPRRARVPPPGQIRGRSPGPDAPILSRRAVGGPAGNSDFAGDIDLGGASPAVAHTSNVGIPPSPNRT